MASYRKCITYDENIVSWQIWKWTTINNGHLIECIGNYLTEDDCQVALMTFRHEDED